MKQLSTAAQDGVVAAFFGGPNNDVLYSVARDCVVYVWEWKPDRKHAATSAAVSAGAGVGFVLDHFGSGGGAAAGDPFGGGNSDSGGFGGAAVLHAALGKWVLRAKHFLWNQPTPSSGATNGVAALTEYTKAHKKRKKKRHGGGAGGGGEGDDDGNDDEDELGRHGEKSGVGLRVRCAELHRNTSLLAVGLSNGTFSLFDMASVSPAGMGGSAGGRPGLGGGFGSGGLAGATMLGKLLASKEEGDSLPSAALSLKSSIKNASKQGLTPLHTLSISAADVGSVAINQSGEWLAFGAKSLGQLLVWEWQSESYVLKQQGHSYDMNALAFSPDGAVIATGADDNKVKLWSATSGFCFVTFSDHTAPVTSVVFGPASGRVVLSASLDGTVRAYDLLRYKNFRTLASPDPVQFTSLAVDPSGEIVVAGANDPFSIFVWALNTGRLLDVLTGHEGPVACLSFDAVSGHLASGSWDKTVKVWNVYRNECLETLPHPAEVLCLAYRPDGKQMTSGTLHGQLHVWDPEEGDELGVIDGQRDIAGGRGAEDRATAAGSSARRHFSSVCYSADGTCVLAGGRSRFVCIYEVSQQILLKKFQISHNRSRDGVQDLLDSRLLVDGSGPVSGISGVVLDGDDDELLDPSVEALPGAKRAEDGSRIQGRRREIVVGGVQFSSTGREWACATSDGLLVYALSEDLLFAPVGLEGEDVTPAGARECLRVRDFSRALLMALQLGDAQSSITSGASSASSSASLLTEVLEGIPKDAVALVVRSLGGGGGGGTEGGSSSSSGAVCRLLEALAKRLGSTKHLEFYLAFSLEALRAHGPMLRPHAQSATSRGAAGAAGAIGRRVIEDASSAAAGAAGRQRIGAALRGLQKAVLRQQSVLLALCDENDYTLRFLRDTMQCAPNPSASTSDSASDLSSAVTQLAPARSPAPPPSLSAAVSDEDDDDDDADDAAGDNEDTDEEEGNEVSSQNDDDDSEDDEEGEELKAAAAAAAAAKAASALGGKRKKTSASSSQAAALELSSDPSSSTPSTKTSSKKKKRGAEATPTAEATTHKREVPATTSKISLKTAKPGGGMRRKSTGGGVGVEATDEAATSSSQSAKAIGKTAKKPETTTPTPTKAPVGSATEGKRPGISKSAAKAVASPSKKDRRKLSAKSAAK